MDQQILLAVLLIELSAAIATVDGIYFHLYKYRLYARPDSITEHWTHTLRALMFGPLIYLLFDRPFAGPALWATVALALVDFGVQSWDVLVERDSRASLGGLTPAEYWLHVAAITTHVAAVTLILAARPRGAWSGAAPTVVAGSWPAVARWAALAIAPGSLGLGALHLWLLQPRYRRSAEVAA